jgi:hypothetical protein
MRQNIDLHVVVKLRMRGAVPPLFALYSFMACTVPFVGLWVEPLVKHGHRQECDTVMNFGDVRCNVLSDCVPCRHEESVKVQINSFLTLVLYTELSCQLDTPAILPLRKET